MVKRSHSVSRRADENLDWTQISDPVKRRRLQNLLAQRRYRETHDIYSIYLLIPAQA